MFSIKNTVICPVSKYFRQKIYQLNTMMILVNLTGIKWV